jgi:hypothetical protein
MSAHEARVYRFANVHCTHDRSDADMASLDVNGDIHRFGDVPEGEHG